jgi:ATP-binding protein involved in chromosome partitioning
MIFTEEKIIETLHLVKHPKENKSVVELGYISNIKSNEGKISLDLTLKNPKDPFAKSIVKGIEGTLKFYLAEDLQVEVHQKVDALKAVQFNAPVKPLSKVKNIIAVASGKGGVGKSTVAANLAIGLAKTGAKVGLLDADLYGPSAPIMFGLQGVQPASFERDGKVYIVPVEKYGVKVISLGFFIDPKKALIWRGAMATSALNQLINDSSWGELDFLVLDMPPGTGDIHLTIVQTLSLTGAVVVSTPQDVALADARKGVAMFQQPDINVPVLGIIENMAWFTPEELPNNKYYIFGKDGAKKLAEELNVPLLGQIPIVQSIREGGDSGHPVALDTDNPAGMAFRTLAENVIKQVQWRNENLDPTKIVEIKTGVKKH